MYVTYRENSVKINTLHTFALLVSLVSFVRPACADSRISVEPFMENGHLSFHVKNGAKQAVTIGSASVSTTISGKYAVCASSSAMITLNETAPEGTLQTSITAEQLISCLHASPTNLLAPKLLGVSSSADKCPTCRSSPAWNAVPLLYDHIQIGKGWKSKRTSSVLLYFDAR